MGWDVGRGVEGVEGVKGVRAGMIPVRYLVSLVRAAVSGSRGAGPEIRGSLRSA